MRTRYPILILSCWLASAGCDVAVVGGEEPCPGGDCSQATETSPENGVPTDPSATDPNATDNNLPPTTFPGCASDADCQAPDVCNTAAGKCVPPDAKNNAPCDPIEGQGCPPDQTCLSGVCMPPPGGCVTNDECPAGYLCQSGVCQPDTNGQAGCATNSACPSGQICINGDCIPQEACNIPHALDRMKGNWKLESELHVRDGLEGLTKGLLSLASILEDIIEGKFAIGGVPAILGIGTMLQNIILQYVPPWGVQVIKLLATIDDVLDDWKVVSVEHIQALGNDQYKGWSSWQLVQFQFQGITMSHPPQAVPGLGTLETTEYTAREVCGVLFIDNHKVKNSIGKLVRYAIEAVITGFSCADPSTPCYNGLYPMFNDLIDCNGLATSLASSSTFPGLAQLVLATCNGKKQDFINYLIQELDNLTLNMTTMSLKGKTNIQNNNTVVNGKWYGTLGGAFGKGNFEGTFWGFRVP